MKEEKKEEKKDEKKESSESIVKNIIMISPVPKVHKKLVKISKDREKDLSTLVEEIVEDYVNNIE